MQILRYRDREFLDSIARDDSGRLLRGRAFRIWRWGPPLVDFVKCSGISNWHDLASDKGRWTPTLEEMAQWFRSHRAYLL